MPQDFVKGTPMLVPAPLQWRDSRDQRIAELTERRDELLKMLEYISTADVGGLELHPVGPNDVEYSEDGRSVVRYIGPWLFLHGKGDTFIEAVRDAMAKDSAAKAEK